MEIWEGLEKNSDCMYLYDSNGCIGQDGGCDSLFLEISPSVSPYLID